MALVETALVEMSLVEMPLFKISLVQMSLVEMQKKLKRLEMKLYFAFLLRTSFVKMS